MLRYINVGVCVCVYTYVYLYIKSKYVHGEMWLTPSFHTATAGGQPPGTYHSKELS